MALRWKSVLIPLGFLGLVLALVAQLPETPPAPKTGPQAEADRLLSALIRCENQTEAQLADPEGFDPQPYGEWLASEAAPDRRVFTFKARARNAFGALVWATFQCSASYDPSADRWTATVTQLLDE